MKLIQLSCRIASKKYLLKNILTSKYFDLLIQILMGSDCMCRSEPREGRKSQNINKRQQYQPRRSPIQILLAPNLPLVEVKKHISLVSSVNIEGESSRQKIDVQKNLDDDCVLMVKLDEFSYTNQLIQLQKFQTKSTLSDEKKMSSNNQIVLSELDRSVLSSHKIQLNIQCPSQVRESLVSGWDKSNFNDQLFFKTVCFDNIFANSLKITPNLL